MLPSTHSSTYDHRTMRIRLPVRSAIYKHCTGGLVVRWVTTSESPLLYVFEVLMKFFLHVGATGIGPTRDDVSLRTRKRSLHDKCRIVQSTRTAISFALVFYGGAYCCGKGQ